MSAPFPHCNSEVIHEPGACYYCDQYKHLQEARVVSGQPFSPREANGWSGNVAVKAGEEHSHMGATYIVGMRGPEIVFVDEPGDRRPCTVNFKRGWYCKSPEHGDQPCALIPKWWNLRYRRLRREWR